MHWVSSALLAVQVITSLAIIVLVLLQQGKGADMGSSFGSGSAGSLFGSSGAANFLSRTTKWTAIVFFAVTIGLAYTSHHTSSSILEGGLMQNFQDSSAPPAGSAVPAAPGGAQSGSAVPNAPQASQGSAVQAAPGSSQSSSVPQTSSVPESTAPANGQESSYGSVQSESTSPAPSVDSAASPAREPAAGAQQADETGDAASASQGEAPAGNSGN